MRIRRKKKDPGIASPREDADASLQKFLDYGPKRAPRKRKPKPAPLKQAIEDAQRRSSSGDWDDATGATFVGLYALCHRLIYGVEPADLVPRGPFQAAAKAAKTCLHANFDDDPSDFVDFIRWTWVREEKREAWARANHKERGRISIRLQFSPSLITDYRVDRERRRNRRGF